MGLTACKRLIFTRGWTVGMATMINIDEHSLTFTNVIDKE